MTEKRAFLIAALITIVATVTLIFIGGLVRAEGAGLGCPDWPKCFGLWVPPSSVDQIPHEFFQNHPDVKPADFNVVQTYTEYFNRLVGVSIGFLILWTAYRSWKIRNTNQFSMFCSLSAAVLVAYQGWLGGQVVKSRLTEWVVTSHMLLALLIVALLITGRAFAAPAPSEQMAGGTRAKLLWTNTFLIAVTLTQILIGTRVRETVDFNLRANPDLPRSSWITSLGTIDWVHRTFALAVVGAAGLMLFAILRERVAGPARKYAFAISGLIVLQMLVGTTLAYFSFPSIAQMLHLTNGATIFCIELILLLHLARVPANRPEEATARLAA